MIRYRSSRQGWLRTGSFVLFLFFNLAFSGEMDGLVRLFPESGTIEGWVRDGETNLTTDEASLADFINGAAPFYLEHGVEEAGFQDYVKEGVYASLEIYRLQNGEQAQRLYADIHVENPEPLKIGSGTGRFVGGLIGVFLVEFYQDACFVRLTIADKTTTSKEALLKFTAAVSENIRKGADDE